jgi:hypothetical protein
MKPLEVRQAPLGERFEPGRQRLGRGPVGGEARRGMHAVIPVRGPRAVAVPRAGRPGQHRGVERHVQCPAQGAQDPFGVGEQVAGIDHRPAERLEDLRLLAQAQVVQVRLGAHPGVGGEQLARVPDQVGVPQRGQRGAVHLGQQVVRHVLGVADAHPGRQRATGLLGEHHPPVGGLAGDDRVPAGMRQVRSEKIKSVERFVGDHRVRAVLPGPHQCGGYRTRARPHRDAG